MRKFYNETTLMFLFYDVHDIARLIAAILGNVGNNVLSANERC